MLTKEEVQAKIFGHVGDKYTIASEYLGINKPLTLHCNKHNVDFSSMARNFTKSDGLRKLCPECVKENRNLRYAQNRIEVKCAYCGKVFVKSVGDSKSSRSGLYFCCREHKDFAQRLNSGVEFDVVRPAHYGTGASEYRACAFRSYAHQCAICQWHDDEDILEVHHIDEDRQNNAIDNLIILCPICHRKLTSHKYKLIGRDAIVKL